MTLRKSPQSVDALENLGLERLSPSFFMRDFLYSEVANHYGLRNVPDDPALALHAGRQLCTELLEPLQQAFGRIAIRSGYRSSAVNQRCNEGRHGCAANTANYAAHIWDQRDAAGHCGAMACVVVPWFADQVAHHGADWRAMAYWIHNHLPYNTLQFFPKLCAFNIGWYEGPPQRSIHSYIQPTGYLLRGEPPNPAFAAHYAHFPAAQR